MALEKQRGISVTTSVLQFEYDDVRWNLLDTPGHKDFSEDTYRTLMAADCAIMILDAARGVEPQTRKLFHVCRLRNTPVVTFINKMDRPARDAFALMSEVEEVLGRHPDVLEAAVVGRSDPEWQTAVTAVVVARNGANPSADEIRGFCAQSLAGYKVPKRVEFVDELPKTTSGKVRRSDLS